MKVLLTGADGFIGSHLAEELVKRGHDVTALVMYNSFDSWGWLDVIPKETQKHLRVVAGDIRDPYLMHSLSKGMDSICHLAALIAIPYSYSAPDSYVQTNIQGTLNLLNAARASGVRKFVHTSTSEVYGTARYVPMDELHPLQGQSPYSASKIAADQLVYSYSASFELNTLTIRPFNTYGPRQSARAVIPTIISQVAEGAQALSLGALTPTRDFTYIPDTVDGFVKALENSQVSGEAINLGTGFEISIQNLASEILRLMGKDLEILPQPLRFRPTDSEVQRLVSDNTKASKILGWEPQHGGLAGLIVGLEKTIDWFTKPDNLKKYRSQSYTI